jgi:hypothetical protein
VAAPSRRIPIAAPGTEFLEARWRSSAGRSPSFTREA